MSDKSMNKRELGVNIKYLEGVISLQKDEIDRLKSRIDRAVEFISSLMDANEKHTISSQVIKILTEGVKCSGK